MTSKISIALIESSYLLGSGLENLFGELPGAHIITMFDGTEKQLVQKISNLRPDLIMLNPQTVHPSLNAFVNSLAGEAPVIGLIDRNTPAPVRSKFSYTLKIDESKHDLLYHLQKLIKELFGHRKENNTGNPLSEREKTVLRHITLGMTNQEIAEKLFLSIHTVMTHRKNITKKLGIKTVSGLTVYALLNKIIDINDIKQA